MDNLEQKSTVCNNTLIKHATHIPNLFSSLSINEKIMVYYLYRASIPGQLILADQCHRNSVELLNCFDQILKTDFSELPKEFYKDVESYMTFLILNNGIYFKQEEQNNKRTPSSLNLKHLTKENLELYAKLMDINLEHLYRTIFDDTYESTKTVPDNIAQSGCNIYSEDFTNEDFNKLTPFEKTKLDAYFYINHDNDRKTPVMVPYTTKYASVLNTSIIWLKRAYNLATSSKKYFDAHFVAGLDYLVKYLESGDEELFKKHTTFWLQSSCKLDYCFGFIEQYKDPMGYRGSFQAEITVKTVDMSLLNSKLPDIEKQLPFPEEFKRDMSLKVPVLNASMNQRLYGSGDLGALSCTAAYCLPNYDDVRSEIGSKQIIYPVSKPIGLRTNKKLYERMFVLCEDRLWHDDYDPNYDLNDDIWNTQCILHETLGHASGKNSMHILTEEDNLVIDEDVYSVGDSIEVTSKNYSQFMLGYGCAIEEMRAEIIALYVSVYHLDELLNIGLMSRWATLLSKTEIKEKLILGMSRTGLRRYVQQADNATEITGSHALANVTILDYLITDGGVELVIEQSCDLDGRPCNVAGVKIKDFATVCKSIKTLMLLVQHIKSTANGNMAKKLIETHGKSIKYPEAMKILKNNTKLCNNGIKIMADIFPYYTPMYDPKTNEINNVVLSWADNVIDVYRRENELSYDTS